MTLKELYLKIKPANQEISMNAVALFVDELFQENTMLCPLHVESESISSDFQTIAIDTDIDSGIGTYIVKIEEIYYLDSNDYRVQIPRLIEDSIANDLSYATWQEFNRNLYISNCLSYETIYIVVRYLPATFAGAAETEEIPVPRLVSNAIVDFIKWKIYSEKAGMFQDVNISQQMAFLSRYHTKEFFRKIAIGNNGDIKTRIRIAKPGIGSIV